MLMLSASEIVIMSPVASIPRAVSLRQVFDATLDDAAHRTRAETRVVTNGGKLLGHGVIEHDGNFIGSSVLLIPAMISWTTCASSSLVNGGTGRFHQTG